ncbi:Chaperone surA [Gossypium australe]|uniref:Chaperone surA n=1 Tax=Gossypium australe TaxID=47621 RepID=A0A5B6VLS4_9ROSI|nr:Chaperone surA [Gossypium australe]
MGRHTCVCLGHVRDTRSTHMVMDPERDVANDVESNALAPTEGMVCNENENRPTTMSQRRGGEAREAFLHMMNTWIRKHGAEEFRARKDDDPKKAEF